MKDHAKHFANHVFEYGMNRLDVQIKPNLVRLGYGLDL
jgi:hypothetical protein